MRRMSRATAIDTNSSRDLFCRKTTCLGLTIFQHLFCLDRLSFVPAESPLNHTMANKIESPRGTLIPFISAEEAATMAYPPDALPGARDVETFYGSMRVYEWGPVDGDKVLFVHGDATPSLVFSKIAQGLVDAGYRVMLFGE